MVNQLLGLRYLKKEQITVRLQILMVIIHWKYRRMEYCPLVILVINRDLSCCSDKTTSIDSYLARGYGSNG